MRIVHGRQLAYALACGAGADLWLLIVTNASVALRWHAAFSDRGGDSFTAWQYLRLAITVMLDQISSLNGVMVLASITAFFIGAICAPWRFVRWLCIFFIVVWFASIPIGFGKHHLIGPGWATGIWFIYSAAAVAFLAYKSAKVLQLRKRVRRATDYPR
jgi:hypothetical protein